MGQKMGQGNPKNTYRRNFKGSDTIRIILIFPLYIMTYKND
ncbi:hypothetical protein FACS1894147_12570 [Spirochaetia bacterium]|nr:hypothetical protein FACS1894147_12570 [Spirochaetia bacterium]